jgi:tetratricopeptide (TPR) repeat protein
VGFALATVELARVLAVRASPWLSPGIAPRVPAAGFMAGVVLLVGTIAFDARQGLAWREEVRFWFEAAARHPDEAAYAHSLGAARLRASDAPGAIEAFSTALGLDPTLPRAQYNLGLAYTTMGRLDEARDAYERAIERDPSDVKALVNLGLLYERRGEPERARQAYQAAVRVAPGLDWVRERVERLGGGR